MSNGSAARQALESCISKGGVVLFPSDGLYGLACDPLNREAVERIHRIKGRDDGKPSAVMYFSPLAMRELIIGVGTRDTGRVIRAYQMLGMLLPGADLKLIEEAMGTMFDYFWGKSMTELQKVDVKEMHQFAHQFSDLVYDMPFQIPQDIIFLGRAVGILSGMCTGLDPGFNLWEYLTPYAGKLLAEETAAGKGAWLDELGGLARKLVALPGRADAMLTKIERGDLVTRDPQLAEQVRRLERAVLKAAGSVVFAALLFGGIQFYLAALTLPAGILWVGAALSLLWLLLSRPR